MGFRTMQSRIQRQPITVFGSATMVRSTLSMIRSDWNKPLDKIRADANAKLKEELEQQQSEQEKVEDSNDSSKKI